MNAGEDVEARGPSCTVGRILNWYNPLSRENNMEVPPKNKNRATM